MSEITKFIKHHYRHFNAAALVDAAQAYVDHLASGGRMFMTIAGAMSRCLAAPLKLPSCATWTNAEMLAMLPMMLLRCIHKKVAATGTSGCVRACGARLGA